MFCGNCGTNVPDGTEFCPNCGNALNAAPAAPAAPVAPAAPAYQAAPVAPMAPAAAPVAAAPAAAASKLKNMDKEKVKKIGIAAGAAVLAIILLVVLISALGGGAPVKAAKRITKAEFDEEGGDTYFKYVMQCEIDAKIKEDDKGDDKIDSLDDIIKEFNKSNKEHLKNLDNFKVKSATKLKIDKKFKSNAMDNISKYYELAYDDKKVEVKDLAKVSVEYTYTDDDGNEVLARDAIWLFKYDGNWYMISSYNFSDERIQNLKKQKADKTTSSSDYEYSY